MDGLEFSFLPTVRNLSYMQVNVAVAGDIIIIVLVA
jgi:hypothetical protein